MARDRKSNVGPYNFEIVRIGVDLKVGPEKVEIVEIELAPPTPPSRWGPCLGDLPPRRAGRGVT